MEGGEARLRVTLASPNALLRFLGIGSRTTEDGVEVVKIPDEKTIILGRGPVKPIATDTGGVTESIGKDEEKIRIMKEVYNGIPINLSKTTIDNGIFLDSGQPTPWLGRCR